MGLVLVTTILFYYGAALLLSSCSFVSPDQQQQQQPENPAPQRDRTQNKEDPSTRIIQRLSHVIETATGETTTPNCSSDLVAIANVVAAARSSIASSRIPKVVHQTAKSRCVTHRVANAAYSWAFGGEWSYFFHDDAAMMRLLLQSTELAQDFPHLPLVAQNCLVHGTLKADLWRYLLLWQYGGVYADIDAIPASFQAATTIQPEDDAFFVVEQYHLLSQWFMAASPKHPIMFYAVQQSLLGLLAAPDTGSVPAPMVTGPHALHAAFIQFRKDAGHAVDLAIPGNKPVRAGLFVGSHNRTIRVAGDAAHQNEIVNRDALGRRKRREYESMGMRHFQDDRKHGSGVSCAKSILDEHYARNSVV